MRAQHYEGESQTSTYNLHTDEDNITSKMEYEMTKNSEPKAKYRGSQAVRQLLIASSPV